MSQRLPRIGTIGETKALAANFYKDDEYLHIMPGCKDLGCACAFMNFESKL